MSKYDAIVEEKKPGIYDVTSIKSKADEKSIKNFFEVGKLLPGDQSEQATRGEGARIIGVILMILLMQAVFIHLQEIIKFLTSFAAYYHRKSWRSKIIYIKISHLQAINNHLL